MSGGADERDERLAVCTLEGATLAIYRDRLEYASRWRGQRPATVPLRGVELLKLPPFWVLFRGGPGGFVRVTAGGTTWQWALGGERGAERNTTPEPPPTQP